MALSGRLLELVQNTESKEVKMKYFIPAILCFLGLVGVSLAGAPPAECPEACKPIQVKVVQAESCSGAKESCAGSKDSCSGRSTFAQRRAARQEDRQEARAARLASRNSCCGEASTQVVLVAACPETECSKDCCKKCK